MVPLLYTAYCILTGAWPVETRYSPTSIYYHTTISAEHSESVAIDIAAKSVSLRRACSTSHASRSSTSSAVGRLQLNDQAEPWVVSKPPERLRHTLS